MKKNKKSSATGVHSSARSSPGAKTASKSTSKSAAKPKTQAKSGGAAPRKVAAKKAPAVKKKTPVRKVSAPNPVKKAVPKKVLAKKPNARPAKKAPVKKLPVATKRVVKRVAKKAVKKPVAKKAPPKTAVRKQPAQKKPVQKKPVQKKAAQKKGVTKKAGQKKTGPKKPAAKKPQPVKKAAPPKARGGISRKSAPVPAPVPVKKAAVKTLRLAPDVMASGVSNRAKLETFASGAPARTLPLQPRRSGKTRKPRLLWIGDALVPTGFATVTHAVLAQLQDEWDITVSGVNYDGSKHDLPYQVLPAWQGGDMWGMNRFAALCAEFDPAAVIINNDWWNVAQFAKIAPAGVPLLGYMPVDGGGLDPVAMRQISRLHAAVWYTDHGHREAVKAGFDGARHVVPHGIDTGLFHPMDRAEARRILDLNVPKNAFIVGNLNRNQPRKRLDLSIEIFADWVARHQVTNAYLLLHCAQKDSGWDLRRIAAHHGVADRLLCTGGEDMRTMQSTRHLQLIYNSLDVQMTTTLGEGWGLTTMEGMACGVPQIVPDSAALAEWAVPAVKVPCSRTLWTPEITTTGALVDHEPFVQALHRLHQNKAERGRLGEEGLRHVRRGEFQWARVARRLHALAVSAVALAKKQPQA